MRTAIPKNNSSAGQIDRDIKGRIDLPLYQNGHELSRNFFQTIKGDCFYRCGFEFLDEIGYSALYEFKFNQEQSYLLVFRIQYIEFWSYNARGELVRVLDDSGNELTLVHPWGTEIFNLCMTQNCDVMYITHTNGNYPEYQLKRIAANKFTLEMTVYANSGEASLSNESSTTNHGFPFSCAFYENRLNRCSSSKFPTYLYGSKGGSYNDITTGENKNDGYQFDLAEANSKALWIISAPNSLLIGTAEGILTVNGGSESTPITPTDIAAKLSCRVPVSDVKPVIVDGYTFFVSADGRQVYLFEYDVLLEQFRPTNLSKGNYEITKGGIQKLAFKFDRFNLIFAKCNKKLLAICFSKDESVNAWSEFHTEGEFVDICSVTRPDGEFDLFANIKRTINGVERYYLERLTKMVEFSRFEDFVSEIPAGLSPSEIEEIKQNDKYAFYRQIAEELRGCNYLDCSMKYSGLKNIQITYNPAQSIITAANAVFGANDKNKRIWYKSLTGREFGIFDIDEVISSTQVRVRTLLQPSSNVAAQWYLSATVFTGLEHLEGETVSVVGNGGYIGDFQVKNGSIDISSANVNKVGNAVIGLKYKGILKSPNLGMLYQGGETYTSMKNLYKIGFILSFSSGAKVGDSLYNLEHVQDFNPNGLYDVPPLPLDDLVEINLSSSFDRTKNYFIVQDSPLPLHIASIIPHYAQVVRV